MASSILYYAPSSYVFIDHIWEKLWESSKGSLMFMCSLTKITGMIITLRILNNAM